MCPDSDDLDNPYLAAIENIYRNGSYQLRLSNAMELDDKPEVFASLGERQKLVHRYAWAIPDIEAIKTIAEYGPIVEVGAGTGYWAWLLAQAGVDVMPTDPNGSDPDKGERTEIWRRIRVMDATEAADLWPDRSLMMCWPSLGGSWAANALETYEGDTLIYVGEWLGCNATDRFFDMLEDRWKIVGTVEIPRYMGIHDQLYIFTRE